MKKLILTTFATMTIAGYMTEIKLVPVAEAKAKCRVSGLNWKGSHPTLKQGLCDMSRALGPVIITNTKKTSKLPHQSRSQRQTQFMA
jgi:hypothetical protein